MSRRRLTSPQRHLIPGLRRAPTPPGAYDAFASDLAHFYEPARKVLTSYEGPLLRLRRASDDAQRDFGPYTRGVQLNTAAIATWLDGADGYVVTVYDQASGFHVTQADNALQPLYVPDGLNGKPVMRSDSNRNIFLRNPDAPWSGDQAMTGISLSYTRTRGTSTSHNTIWGVGQAVGTQREAIFFCTEDDKRDAIRLQGGNTIFPDSAIETWYLHIHVYPGSAATFTCRQNGSAVAATSSSMNTLNLRNGMTLFHGYGHTMVGFDGDIASVVICDAALSEETQQKVETAMNTYWSVYP